MRAVQGMRIYLDMTRGVAVMVTLCLDHHEQKLNNKCTVNRHGYTINHYQKRSEEEKNVFDYGLGFDYVLHAPLIKGS